MAERVLNNVATSILQQLSDPALEEFSLLWNFGEEVQKLKGTVGTINNVLLDAERRQSKDRLVQGWLADLRAVMFDADDLLDEVAAKALRKKSMPGSAFKKEVGLFFSKSNQLAFIYKIAREVKAIRERLDDIAKDMGKFSFVINQIQHEQIQVLGRIETQSYVPENDVVGRDKDKEEIIKLLLPEGHREKDTYQQKLSVIAVIGFGGLGKTTLAQFVYNDERVQKGFDLCAWACINYFSNLNEVLMEIITSIVKSKPDSNNLNVLQEKLKGNLRGKKYLLVLDDVWDEDADNWSILKTFLDCGKSSSKVLVTTRNTRVADCLDALQPYYQLNVISEEDGWSLFKKMAFREGELDENPKLGQLGRKIAHKCGCVPLALVTIGRMLRSKQKQKMRWLSTVEKEVPELASGNDGNKIMQTLKISYDDLPPMLKHCFAYCSLFPKDHTFKKSELVQLWQAQGFVVPNAEQSLEEVGEEYFYYLIDRCFFQGVSREHRDGCYQYTCKMHDLIHDLAGHVAGFESKCFIGEAPSGIEQDSTLRHISVIDTRTGSSLDYSSLLPHSKALRTLLCRVDINVGTLNMILGSLRMLRILSLTNSNVEKMPDSIGELIHLRYLNLSWSEVEVLPNSICKLYHLQTLRLTCPRLKKLPSKIGKLISLRHLFLKGCYGLTSLPPGLAALTSLVTLDRLIVHHHSGGLRYLDQLDDLCGTVIVELPTVGSLNAVEDARKSNMSRKQRLNGMILRWPKSENSGAPKMADDELKAVIEALEPHDNLQYLQISSYGGSTLPSWVFSLKNVKELQLWHLTLEYLDGRVRFDLLLPSLEILKIERMPNLKGWWKQVAAGGDRRRPSLPYLSHVKEIVINGCPMLTECMPLFGRTEKLILNGVDEKLVRELLIGNKTDTNCSSSLSSSSSTCHYNSRLKELTLSSVKGLTCLPEDWIEHLTALQSLEIQLCDDLSWVSRGGLAHLTSLQELNISWYGRVDVVVKEDEELENGMPWKALQHLRVLTLPVGDKHFQRGLQYLTALEELKIRTWEEAAEPLAYDHEEREGDGMPWKGLKRLRSLVIGYGGRSGVFPKSIQYLCSPQYLEIDNCKELSLSWTTIANMRIQCLQLWAVHKVVSIDEVEEEEEQSPFTSLGALSIVVSDEVEWIHHHIPWKLFSSLTSLQFMWLSNLESLPDGIQHLTSLRKLEIFGCTGIRALPSWMVNLTSLQQLQIWKCSPELKKRCEAGTGEDWHLISHIPWKNIWDVYQLHSHSETETETETSSVEVRSPL